MKDILTIEGNKFYYTDIFLSFIDEQITKHSPNITDLIEENDYVNGELVEIIYGYDEDGNDKEELGIKEVDCEDGYYIPLKNIEIKSIVTHESFNSIKYEVE